VSQAYRLTERAEADVQAIADFIAADSIDAAVKLVLALARMRSPCWRRGQALATRVRI
jgi:plasmid stabilization system protein ParE